MKEFPWQLRITTDISSAASRGFLPGKTFLADSSFVEASGRDRCPQLKKMSCLWWTSVAVFFAIFAQAKCESTAFPVIPSHLLECYSNDGIYHRANRMPSTLESFLDLLRKLEDSPTSRNMNARELSTALLHYLKLDGIQSIRSQTKYFPSHILPFAPSGPEYFKHRLTLVGLVPRIDRNYLASFNETLTQTEMCNLHFMLSYSIDPYKRENERCSPLFEQSRRGRHDGPASGWQPHQNGEYYGRYRRHVDHGAKANSVDGGLGEQVWPRKAVGEGEKGKFVQSKIILKRSSGREKSEVEEIAVDGKQSQVPKEEKDKFTIGDQELLSAGEEGVKTGMQSLVQMGNFGRYGGREYAKAHSADESVFPGAPMSDCPVVNGVVTTPFGSLTIGTVVAGIAAGLNPEEIPPTKLSVPMADLESPSDRVNNVWAATLAGTIADIISSSAVLEQDYANVLKGGWNDSSDPKWYLLSDSEFKYMTEVALRGSLDALLLGINAKEWTAKFQNLKLSQMLEAYYHSGWGSVGAQNRAQLRPKYVPEEILRKQVHLMSLVLRKQKTNVLTVLHYGQISREAVAKVIQYIQMMDDSDRGQIGSLMPTRIENGINLIAVVDSSWGYENLYKIFQQFRRYGIANTVGNKITILCGKDAKVLSSSENSASFHLEFTKDMLFENCTRGMDLPLIFDSLDTTYRKIFHAEKLSLKINTDAQVTVLYPFDSLLSADADYIKDKSTNFRSNFPDVRLVIAPNGRSESFLQLVNSSKDLYPLVPLVSDPNIKSVKELAEGIKQSYQRISRPSCGSYFDDDRPGTEETRVTNDVSPGNVVYYRLLPQYFYTQKGHATVTIKSKLRTPLTVCHSREMERPTGPTPRAELAPDYGPARNPNYSPDFPPEASLYGRQIDPEGPVQCKTITSEEYKIDLDNPCEGASSLRECSPLYISITNPLQDTISIFCYNCKLPINAQYEIAVAGLTCYNSATTRLATPLLFFSLLLARFFLHH